MTWQLLLAANTVLATAYFAISATIAGGLRRARQLGARNPLGTATAAIFLTCGFGHFAHALHLAEPWFGLGDPAARVAADWHMIVIEGVTALVAVTYWSLRRSFGLLLEERPGLFADIDRVRMQQQVSEAEELFRTSFEDAPIGMALVGLDGRFLRVNRVLGQIVGRPAEELVSMSFQQITHEDDLDTDMAHMRRLVAGEIPRYTLAKRYVRPDGQTIPVLLSVSMVRSPAGEPQHCVAQVEDVSGRRAAETARDAAEARFRTSFEAAPIGVCTVGLKGANHGLILGANRAFGELLGRRPQELSGMALAAFLQPEPGGPAGLPLDRLTASARSAGEFRLIRSDGTELWALVSCAHVDDPLDAFAVVHVVDLSERKRLESRLRDLADNDPLTGLPNRRRFDAELRAALEHVHRYGTRAAVLLLDLDGFKYVNDTLGHSAGDELIVRCGQVLRARLRETDVLARLGGDEFAVLLPGVTEDEADIVAGDLVAAIRQDAVLTRVGSRPVRVSTSVGVAGFERGVVLTAEDLMSRADIALYDAKDAGRDRARRFSVRESGRERFTPGSDWASRVRDGLERDRFRLLAQPIVALQDGVPAFHELLLRFDDGSNGLVGPAAFLPAAERSGLVVSLDRWVLHQAVRVLREHEAAGRELYLSVNLSGRSLVDEDLVAELEALLAAEPVAAGHLILEITETVAIADLERARHLTERLHGCGCRFALDDFGAGFASLLYLKHLTFDYVKIDGEFVEQIGADPADRLVIEAAVGIAHGLGARTVAEFVRDEAAAGLLLDLGVDLGQGFSLGEPRPVDELLTAPRAVSG